MKCLSCHCWDLSFSEVAAAWECRGGSQTWPQHIQAHALKPNAHCRATAATDIHQELMWVAMKES